MSRGRRVSNGDRVHIDSPLTLLVGSGAYDDADSVDFVDSGYDGDMPDEGDIDEFEEVTEPPMVEKPGNVSND